MKKLLLLICLSLALVGCGTTPQAKVEQGEAIVIYSVDSAMQAWSEFVRHGKATQAQVDTVKGIYLKYYTSQQFAKAALEKWISTNDPADQAGEATARAAVLNAEKELVTLINQLINK